ncbi:MAG: thioredoxin domain-containing protein [Ignavibacteriales bacterium]|nr:MAG: thioredoxin domain-containing protein [Ignavibacteriales bacterium]
MSITNRLIKEKSPYLLQHAGNPVDWYPWTDEAFDKARQEDKPVFLSIGYSTCHWCHVMEKESFEDRKVAELLNDAFISIKVDREERPDIDALYMSVCQILTGGGGWPMTIIMTPEKKPFFAGTYFPRESRFGRIGMLELIPRIKELWKTKRDEILNSSDQISNAVISSSSLQKGKPLKEDIFKIAFTEFEEKFDEQFGGFGSSPKFPSPHNLMFLLRYYRRYNDNKALNMVEKTLTEMRNGGIYDHIGFGFSRYSTDREWLVPHYEKMLYDQALLTMAYIEVYQVTKNKFYKDTAEEILSYVIRELTSHEGGFFSAEDADSEGVEGKFYLWSAEEIRSILGNDADIFMKYFNVREKGNLPENEMETAGANILHIKKRLKDFSQEEGYSEEVLRDKFEKARQKLFKVREKRIHPIKDDKVLTDWNGLMISAFAKAAQVFNKKIYTDIAAKACEFIFSKMFENNEKLLHRYREGDAAVYGNADDYAFFISALLDLYETTFEIKYLKKAVKLNEDFLKYFWDDASGGFFFTPVYGEKLISRQKEIYDGAVPSGNSVAMLNLLRIARITAETKYEETAEVINKVFSSQVSRYPAGFTQFLIALNFVIGPSKEIIISGEDYAAFAHRIFRKFLPEKIVVKISSVKDEILELVPYLKDYTPVKNKTNVFICENYSCNLPVYSIQALEQNLI